LRKDGNKLKITARLINVANGYQLWSETFERDSKDILAVQAEVADRVAKALQVKMQLDRKLNAAGQIAWVADSAAKDTDDTLAEQETLRQIKRNDNGAFKSYLGKGLAGAGGNASQKEMQRISMNERAEENVGRNKKAERETHGKVSSEAADALRDLTPNPAASGSARKLKDDAPTSANPIEKKTDAAGGKLACSAAISFEAYNYCQMGRQAAHANNPAGKAQAAQYFAKAVEKAPQYAQAYCGLANTVANPTDKKAYAQQALDLDPALAEAHLEKGTVQGFHDWDLAAGEQELRAALKSNPNLAPAHARLGWLLGVQGRTNEALLHAKKGVDLDRYSPSAHQLLAETYYFARQNEQAVAQARKALELDPKFAPAYAVLGWAALQAGSRTPEIKAGEAAAKCYAPGASAPMEIRKENQPANAAPGRAELFFATALANAANESNPVLLAAESLAQNDKAQALDFLEEACALKDPACLQLKVNPAFDELRNDTRFQALLAKSGLAK
jgi:Tfp pilus assembly protein PilF